jgi:formamidopyrimidine-DNA glycosylase
MTTPIEPPKPGLEEFFVDLNQQLLVLSLALGCSLKATAHRDPERAQAIEDNLRHLMSGQDVENWQPRAKNLLDLMYSALQERVKSE